MVFLPPSVYLIFLIWDVIEVIVIYFVVVETKGPDLGGDQRGVRAGASETVQ